MPFGVTIYGTSGDDVITDSTTVAGQPFATSGDDTIYGYDGNDLIRGGDGNDAIYGGDGNDVLGGGPGDDSIYGGAGNDLLIGSVGNNTLDGGDGIDAVAYTQLSSFIVSGVHVDLGRDALAALDRLRGGYVHVGR